MIALKSVAASAASVEIEILAGQTVIGTARVAAWDYGMGVAGGDFVASNAYSRCAHATIVDGERASQVPSLSAYTTDGEQIECEIVAVSDWSETVGPDGREVELFGLDLPRYFGREPASD